MRILIPAAALALLAAPALAQTTPAPATPAPATSEPATPAPATSATPPAAISTPAKQPVAHHRQTLQQRFDAANTSKDGHLTKDQAAAAKWSYVTRHFAAMDAAKKGYVTMADIGAYAKAQRAKYHKPAASSTAPAAAAPAPAAPAGGSNGQ